MLASQRFLLQLSGSMILISLKGGDHGVSWYRHSQGLPCEAKNCTVLFLQ